ncbi:MAG: DJ-1/PfpI family protein [Muribaculaceae bacterium]|nr:DJ-1/PfpI family protein [Muribaculaceae bacterium]
MNTSYIFLAQGFEEIEALTVVDVMRRAGMDVKTISITGNLSVRGAHGITVEADALYEKTDFITPEWLILPGGMPGSTNLSEYAPLNSLLKTQAQSGKIAAICAAPAVVLAPLGILDGKEATCYPGFEKSLGEAVRRDAPVIALDRLITANGPSSAMRFALAIVANSMGESVAQEVGSSMLFYDKRVNFYF